MKRKIIRGGFVISAIVLIAFIISGIAFATGGPNGYCENRCIWDQQNNCYHRKCDLTSAARCQCGYDTGCIGTSCDD